jgi:predicted metal-dependent peptidase
MNQSKTDLAKVKLLLDHPFFSSILLKRPLVEDQSIPTACTDGVQIWYNNEFMNKFSVAEVTGILAHEIMHIVSFHNERRNGRDHKLWNYACDYAINLILVDNAIKLPDCALLNAKYKDMSPEDIYALLEKEENPIPEHQLGIGDFKAPQGHTKQEVAQHIETIKMDVSEAALMAKMRGKLPKGMEMVIEQSSRVGQDWRQILSAFLTQITKSDYSFSRPNPRYISQGFFLPTLSEQTKGKIILAVDTSGSNYAKEVFQKITNEMMLILSLSADTLTVLFCDSKIAHVQEIDPNNPEPLTFRGGGGTAFTPVTEWIEENDADPEVLIYFTDLECDHFPKEPAYPTMWISNNIKLKAPYGETVYID